MIGRIASAFRAFGGWVGGRAKAVWGGVSASSFRGASTGRLFSDWGAAAMHPDKESQYALRDLRARARDLVRNNPYAQGIVDSFVDNVIGWEGIRLHPEVKSRDGKMNRSVNDRIRAAWREWGLDFASVDEVDSWLDLQELIVSTWVVDGEVFIRQHKAWDNPFGYAVQLIDADLLDENFNVPPDESGVEIRMGIEMDAVGRRRAYHFYKRHPADLPRSNRERVRVSASEVIHFFSRRRVGQNRGYSMFAPALATLKMIDGYEEAELVAARLAAAKMGFITNDTPEAIQAYAARLAALNDDGDEAAARIMDVSPGLIEELMPGQGFQSFDPSHPNEAFEVFLKVMLRRVSKSFGLSYLTVTGDLEGANYSSMRAGLLPERDHWRVLQVETYNRVHRRVYATWRGMAMLTGALRVGSMISANFAEHSWKPRGWKWVDPAKDLDAAERGVKLGVMSRTRIAADQGVNYESIVDELEDEEAYAEEHGVDVSGIKAQTVAARQEHGDDTAPTNGNGNGKGAHNRITEVLTNGTY